MVQEYDTHQGGYYYDQNIPRTHFYNYAPSPSHNYAFPSSNIYYYAHPLQSHYYGYYAPHPYGYHANLPGTESTYSVSSSVEKIGDWSIFESNIDTQGSDQDAEMQEDSEDDARRRSDRQKFTSERRARPNFKR